MRKRIHRLAQIPSPGGRAWRRLKAVSRRAEHRTAQGTSGHARPVNDDLQGALGDFVGTNSTQHRCKCMRMCTHVQGCESANHGTCLAAVSCWKNEKRPKTNDDSTRSVNRMPIVATCGKVYNNKTSSGDSLPTPSRAQELDLSSRSSLRGWKMLRCGSRTSIPRSSSWTLPSVGCIVTMAPLLLEVPWDAKGTTTCTSRNVNACLQRPGCLELHRLATHATLCRLQRCSVGRWDEVAVVTGLWDPISP
jgi:hypothetical protein